jgi:hypothetical protein
LGVNLLFPLSLVAGVGIGNGFETLAQSFPGSRLLRVCEQLIGLRPNLPPLIIRQLLTHLFNQNKQRPASTFSVSTTLGYASGSFNDWFGLLPMS